MIDERKRRILQAIIDDYILTAVPVGSRTISKKYDMGLSSATIRNEMSDLEELGYLDQPHVSAGRVPSAKAYRLYVDQLLRSGVLPSADEADVRAYFGDRLSQMEDVVAHAAQVLSELTHYTAVVMLPKQQELRIARLQLVPVTRATALLVIVTDSGIVRDSVIRVSEMLDADALYAISRMLTERLAGHTLHEVQSLLHEITQHMRANERVLRGISELAAQMEKQGQAGAVMVGGSHNILNYPEYSDVEKARTFLSVLETKDKLRALLSQEPSGMTFTVRIGPETGMPEMSDLSVVTASYGIGQDTHGTLGVIGPTRMPYARVMAILSKVGRSLTEILSEEPPHHAE